MSPGVAGFLLGAGVGSGLLLTWRWFAGRGAHRIAARVAPYVGGLLHQQRPAVTGRLMAALASRVDAVLGGAASVRRRLDRAGSHATVADFRVEQVVWGLACFALAAVFAVAISVRTPGRAMPLAVLCAVAFAFGVLLRDNRLTAQAATRERELLAEFPAVAELLALSVAAGEAPGAAMERVASRSRGAMAGELHRLLGEMRTGTPLAAALDQMGRRTGLPVVARFAEAMSVSLERGTPLADVLHAQAHDVREAQRRTLIESGAKREVFMLTPVVFLVLPTVVLFAFYPGLVGLHLVAP